MNPPLWPVRWLKRLLLPELIEHLEGDLYELYEDRLENSSVRIARLLYLWDCLQLVRPSLFKPLFPKSTFTLMLENHIKIGYRNLLKYKNYTLLNLLGLSIGIAASITLYRVIAFENSYDSFHDKIENLYYVAEEASEYGVYYQTRTPAPPKLKEDLPEVTRASRFLWGTNIWLTYEDIKQRYIFTNVDPDFAEMFSYKVLEGDLKKTLNTKGQVAITLEVSKAFFGYEKAVGKVLTSLDGKNYIVGAVLDDVPDNSSFEFYVLGNWEMTPDWIEEAGDWHNTFMTAVIQLQSGVEPRDIQDKLDVVSADHFLPEGINCKFHLVRLDEYYKAEAGNEEVKALLLIIALVIIIIAFVNFVNLTSAQSLNRLKEVGLRKVMGSGKTSLIGQFAIESTITCIIASIIAYLLTYCLTGPINSVFDLKLGLHTGEMAFVALVVLGITIVMGLLAGFYPAIYLTTKDIITSLKGDAKRGSNKLVFQKSLIIVQYTASILLIAGTIIIWRQINHMKTQDLNFDSERVIVLEMDSDSFRDAEKGRNEIKRFRREMTNQSFIESAAFCQKPPGSYWNNYNSFTDVASNTEIHLRQTTISDMVVPTLNMEIVMGRNFDRNIASDTATVLINEAALKAYGWNDLENKVLRGSGGGKPHRVVGVIKDYHYRALAESVEPMIHWGMGKDPAGQTLLVRYSPGKANETLNYLKQFWEETGSFAQLKYSFLDARFNELYNDYELVGTLTASFASVAIILASLGLFALASYMIRQRRKEIGIRKVMGASNRQITLKLSFGFLVLVTIAITISVPTIWYASKSFLSDFSYRINPGPDVYLIAAIFAILLAIASVSIRAFIAAAENPVHSLRDE